MIPQRAPYLTNQAQTGQKIMGVLPAQYPREMLWAFDILPAEIWDPPGDIVAANTHLQTTICPVVKRSLEFILQDPDPISAGYLFPHTCDSLQNLATLVKDLIGVPQRVYTFYNPKGAFNRTTRSFYRENLLHFQQLLEQEHGPLDQQKLIAACQVGSQIDAKLIALQNARASGRLALSNLEHFQLIRAGEYLLPQDYLAILEHVDISEQDSGSDHTRILISGILPPSNEMLVFLDEIRISLVAQDLLSGSRRVPLTPAEDPEHPLEYLTDRFFLLPPCSTNAGDLQRRLSHLKKLIESSRSAGVLFNIVKFCEPELFDHRFLVQAVKDMGLSVLTLETELQEHFSGREKTRIQAFAEMLKERAPA